MQIQINTDHNIGAHQAWVAEVSGKVGGALSRFSAHITRVEVHLSDQNSLKSGESDKRCVMEARLEGRQPIAVSHEAASLDQAIEGASEKLARMIENTLGRMREHQSRKRDRLLHGPKSTDE